MEEIQIPGLVSLLIGLQFASFGWRIHREITVGDLGEKTWFPILDKLNLASMFITFLACILLPLVTGEFGQISRAVLGSALLLLILHPVNMLGHYELLTESGRLKYSRKIGEKKGIAFEELIYFPRQEAISVGISLLLAVTVGYFVYATS
uniref:Uncharacterized protein n=1 Tax=Candidatus Kentrum sp. DK TaxID=2126562 RepID=A0A450S6H2_9GAMM|nr:MAG: hypothetical protein BECKDK2373C_GA0170839_101829 [Candidatus Kentron sp. DK]